MSPRQCKNVGCIKLATRWRQCGAGCNLEFIFCDSHGGDERAAEEMSKHIENDHNNKSEK